jgi:tRNA (uracil-5-)-methyltransferase
MYPMKKKKKIFHELAEKYRGKPAVPRCKHFGNCGGCSLQDIDYIDQLLLKREYLNNLFDGIYRFDSVNESAPYQYRNRMDFVNAFDKTGLRRAGTYRHVVEIESCEIMQERSNAVFKEVRPLLKHVDDYNYLAHEGYLRYVVLRQARFTGELMLNFVIAKRDNRLDAIIGEIYDRADSISTLLNSGMADLSSGEVIEIAKGGTIVESFNGIRFTIAPNSFFQPNSEIALRMYRQIKDEAAGRVLDIYSGVGSISLFIADACSSVTGVEILNEAVEVAEKNKYLNNIENVGFVCEDALKFIRNTDEHYDTIILDPPRSGMNPRMIKHIKEMLPHKIIYMSCNPESFKRDLSELTSYTLEGLEAFDMFPQTPHLETLAILKRR